jgi:hypothetical protein
MLRSFHTNPVQPNPLAIATAGLKSKFIEMTRVVLIGRSHSSQLLAR